MLQALNIESFAGHNSFRKMWNLIQNLHFLGLSSGMLQAVALNIRCCQRFSLTCSFCRQMQQFCLLEKKIDLLEMK